MIQMMTNPLLARQIIDIVSVRGEKSRTTVIVPAKKVEESSGESFKDILDKEMER